VIDAGGTELRITASFGVTSFTPSDQKEDPTMAAALVERADKCLYQAKKEGRNRVISAQL
jgi:PleD family two-component response regulator